MVITFHVTLILEISTITPIGVRICVVLLGVNSSTPRLAILIGECVGPGASFVFLATTPKWEDTGISSSALLCPAFWHNCRMTKKYCMSWLWNNLTTHSYLPVDSRFPCNCPNPHQNTHDPERSQLWHTIACHLSWWMHYPRYRIHVSFHCTKMERCKHYHLQFCTLLQRRNQV